MFSAFGLEYIIGNKFKYMGRSKNGVLGSVNGKIANVVFYELNGQDVVRSNPGQYKIVSPALKADQKGMALIINFLSKVKPFIKAGFKNEARGTIYNYHNLAVSYNKLNAIRKTSNGPEIVFENISLSRGSALSAENPQVSVIQNDLIFSWSANSAFTYNQSKDQVMMLAYFPAINEAIFNIAGNVRQMGTDSLFIPDAFKKFEAHCYISFVSEDREHVSNSLYLGFFHFNSIHI